MPKVNQQKEQKMQEFPCGLAVQDLVLLLLWLGFSLWPGTSACLGALPRQKKKKKKKKEAAFGMGLILGSAQWVKDLALLQLWRRSQLRLRFNSWPKNFHMLQVMQKKKKKKEILRVFITRKKLFLFYFMFM